jgi:energy-coupling factor transporter transmembrane protein EcfT
VPGSAESETLHTTIERPRGLHPLAWIASLALLGFGIAVDRSWVDLAAASVLLGAAALRAERRPIRTEGSLLVLAAIVFIAHLLVAPKRDAAALQAAAAIAFRLLALLYLLRWAARSALGQVGRWLMAFPAPRKPRFLLLLAESARLVTALLPLALREAEQHAAALKARGIRAGRGLRGFARYLLAWFLPFLGTMLRLSDAYADALTARGYRLGQARRLGIATAWGWREWGALLGSAATAVWFFHGR